MNIPDFVHPFCRWTLGLFLFVGCYEQNVNFNIVKAFLWIHALLLWDMYLGISLLGLGLELAYA